MTEINITRATEVMQKLDIYKPYINDWKKSQVRTLFENYGGYSIGKYDQELELLEKIKEIEKEYDITVYAVTHELTQFGELYDLLYLSNDPQERDIPYEIKPHHWCIPAYCWNKSDDFCSEFGDVFISSFAGGLRRES